MADITLIQLLALSNVLLKSVSMQVERIQLCQPTTPTASQFNARPVSQPRPGTVILRQRNDVMLPRAVRAITSILSLALYAYATAVLGGMTMLPASDAVREMVMLAINAGLGRIKGSYVISQDNHWKTSLVVDVVRWQMDEIRTYVRAEVPTATSGSRP